MKSNLRLKVSEDLTSILKENTNNNNKLKQFNEFKYTFNKEKIEKIEKKTYLFIKQNIEELRLKNITFNEKFIKYNQINEDIKMESKIIFSKIFLENNTFKESLELCLGTEIINFLKGNNILILLIDEFDQNLEFINCILKIIENIQIRTNEKNILINKQNSDEIIITSEKSKIYILSINNSEIKDAAWIFQNQKNINYSNSKIKNIGNLNDYRLNIILNFNINPKNLNFLNSFSLKSSSKIISNQIEENFLNKDHEILNIENFYIKKKKLELKLNKLNDNFRKELIKTNEIKEKYYKKSKKILEKIEKLK